MSAGKKVFLFIWLIFSVKTLLGQDYYSYPIDYDTNFIHDFRHRLNFSLIADIRNSTVNVLTPENKVVNYLTNLHIPQYGAFISYRWLNAGFSLPISTLSHLPSNRGQSEAMNFGIGFTTRKMFFRTTFDRFTGYYNSNPQVLDPDYFLTNYLLPVYEDMTSATLIANLNFGFNSQRYSHRSLMFQSELQRKSAGTILLGISSIGRWVNSSHVMTTDINGVAVTSINYAFAGINLGYVYTWVIVRNFNLSFMILPGINYSIGAYNAEILDTEDPFIQGFGAQLEVRLQMLYELGSFFTGLHYTGNAVSNIANDVAPVAGSNNYIRFNIGYRFRMKPNNFLANFGLSN